ncbi:hypothetical protein [Ruegeria lacuscaerulensis]|uniref:hypothetical protein n=1 Tax=Ruegeria lacuscaerulensis TaxID=55218 RepID=UPI00147B9DAB|nr:hypothetical protein [Ruegeria lacuscaerulensis]
MDYWPSSIPLWHGTDASLLSSIVNNGLGGRNPVDELGAISFLHRAFEAIGYQQNQKEFMRTMSFQNAYFASKQLNAGMNFRHGGVYVTSSQQTAASYATRAPEAVYYCREFLDNLKGSETEAVAHLLDEYPKLKLFLDGDSNPIVLEVLRVRRDRVFDEHGGRISENQIETYNRLFGNHEPGCGIDLNFAFEISEVISADNLSVWRVLGRSMFEFAFEPMEL